MVLSCDCVGAYPKRVGREDEPLREPTLSGMTPGENH